MQLLVKQSTLGMDKLDELHPLTLEFQSRYGLLKFHSDPSKKPEMAVVVNNPQQQAMMIYFVEPTEHLKVAADLLCRHLAAIKQNVWYGAVVHLFQVPESNAVSVVLKIHDDNASYIAQFMGVDPYSPLSKTGEVPRHKSVGLIVDNDVQQASA